MSDSLPACVSAHAPQISLSLSHYFLSDLIGNVLPHSPSWGLSHAVESNSCVGRSGQISFYCHREQLVKISALVSISSVSNSRQHTVHHRQQRHRQTHCARSWRVRERAFRASCESRRRSCRKPSARSVPGIQWIIILYSFKAYFFFLKKRDYYIPFSRIRTLCVCRVCVCTPRACVHKCTHTHNL